MDGLEANADPNRTQDWRMLVFIMHLPDISECDVHDRCSRGVGAASALGSDDNVAALFDMRLQQSFPGQIPSVFVH